MTRSIDFYFDFSSPYGYFASTRVDEIAARHGRTVIWRPILLGAIFKITGQQPLPTIPLKGSYSKHDLARSARLFGVPFKLPGKFPIAGQAPSRAYYWLADRDTALARAAELTDSIAVSLSLDPARAGFRAARTHISNAALALIVEGAAAPWARASVPMASTDRRMRQGRSWIRRRCRGR